MPFQNIGFWVTLLMCVTIYSCMLLTGRDKEWGLYAISLVFSVIFASVWQLTLTMVAVGVLFGILNDFFEWLYPETS